MLLVRTVNSLGLEKVTQVSFEKLNSKDNPAGRPHASEKLKALSQHGPFKTKEIFPYKHAKPETDYHVANMESMVKEIISCFRTAKFGKHQFLLFSRSERTVHF